MHGLWVLRLATTLVSRGIEIVYEYMRLIVNRDVIKTNLFCFPANCKVCFVALIQSFSHYNIVGQKLVNISDLCGGVSE